MTNAIEAALSRRRQVNSFGAWFARSLMGLFGWRFVGEPPDLSKYVLVAVPHTSAWDFVVMLSMDFAFRVACVWMGKQSLFRGPLGVYLRHMGGIPINRASANNVVEQAVTAFERHERMVLTISPEATRGRARRWRTGFYHIAMGAGVPIVCGFIDYGRKKAGFGPVFTPSGEMEADMAIIRDFYRDIVGRHPQNVGQIAVKPVEP
jgi:1-acyl-sn-glycerol-3-phosphate acyltransferase